MTIFKSFFQLIFICSLIWLIKLTLYHIQKYNLTLFFYLCYSNSLCKLKHKYLCFKLKISCLLKQTLSFVFHLYSLCFFSFEADFDCSICSVETQELAYGGRQQETENNGVLRI